MLRRKKMGIQEDSSESPSLAKDLTAETVKHMGILNDKSY